jgi:5'-methylthioadenosine phosphorylase
MTPRDTFALIAGSGAPKMIGENTQQLKRLGPAPTPFGLSAPLYRARLGEAHFLFLPRYGDPGEEVAAPWVNYRANMYALKEYGVDRVLAWEDATAVNFSLGIGQHVLPNDFLDDTRGRESSFYKGTALGGMRHHPLFCEETKVAAESVLRMHQAPYQSHGTYVCRQGPHREAPAEVRWLRSLGGDIVGMALAPEVYLARELEICYVPLCCVVGHAEGVKQRDSEPGAVMDDFLTEAQGDAVELARGQLLTLAAAVSRAVLDDRTCPCAHGLDGYREAGLLKGEDWRQWIGKP